MTGHPTHHVNVIKLKWEDIWKGGLPHLSGLPHLRGVHHLHENRHLILMTLLAQRISPAGREVNLQGSTHLFRLSITLYTYHSSSDRDTWRAVLKMFLRLFRIKASESLEKSLARAVYKEEKWRNRDKRALDHLRMPKLQEIFTTVAMVCHATTDSLFCKMFSPVFCL